jgi:hypothetical protein
MLAKIDASYIRHRPYKAIKRLISYSLFEGRPLTTRGRWFNPVVFFLTITGKHLPVLKKVKRPIFIIGTGRSGTTLLGIVLSMHRDIGFLNEPKAIWHSIFPYEDVMGNYNRCDALYRLDERHASKEVIRSAHRLFGHYLSTVCSKRLVDKYPEHVYRVPFLLTIFPDAKFIFLVRNGWETCASIVEWSKRHIAIRQGEVHDWWGVNRRKWHLLVNQLVERDPLFRAQIAAAHSYDRQYDMATVEWIMAMREGLLVKSLYPRNVMMLRFEDLIAAPVKMLDELLRFCELDVDPVFMRYARERIRPPRSYGRFDMHPDLHDIFCETAKMLGYPP